MHYKPGNRYKSLKCTIILILLREKRKLSHTECSIKSRKAIKEWRNKIKNREQVEKTVKSIVSINYINNHFKCQWSKYTIKKWDCQNRSKEKKDPNYMLPTRDRLKQR